MTLAQRIFRPFEHCINATYKLINALNVDVTITSLNKELKGHPEYPSMLSVAETIKIFGIDSVPLSLPPENLPQVPTPFLAQIDSKNKRHQIFAVVHNITATTATFYDAGVKKITTTNIKCFKDRYKGIILAVEKTVNAGEKNYQSVLQQERRETIIQGTALLLIPMLLLIFIIKTLLFTRPVDSFVILYTTVITAGCLAAITLLWTEIDAHNPLMKRVCGANKKVNCQAVLYSKGAKIFGVSWSSIGFIYFFGMEFNLLLSGFINQQIIFILSCLNLVSLPYIFYSVYYQYRIAKQWCTVCLVVQLLLLLQFILSITGKVFTKTQLQQITFDSFLFVATIFIIFFVISTFFLPGLFKVKENLKLSDNLARLHRNPKIFFALLSEETKAIGETTNLGILLGDKQAKFQIITVCNPFCGPCAIAHADFETILNMNSDVSLRIIFTASPDTNDNTYLPVAHLLSIAEDKNEPFVRHVLNDWYSNGLKDYQSMALKYPITPSRLNNQKQQIEQMNKWCNENKIFFTPTIFINNHQLPQLYKVSELAYFINKHVV